MEMQAIAWAAASAGRALTLTECDSSSLLSGVLRVLLVSAVLTVLATTIACSTDGSALPERHDATAVQWPQSWPVPPLPVMALEHPSGLVWGSPSSYCWQFDETSDIVCKDTLPGSEVNTYVAVAPNVQIPVTVESEDRPDKMFAQVYTRHGHIMVDFRRLATVDTVLGLELEPGDYDVRLEGQWQSNDTSNYIDQTYNTVGYAFGLSVPGEVDLMAECHNTLVGGDVSIVLSSLDDRLRTALDSVNSAGCRFNKPIARVSLTLNNGSGGKYTETFHVDPPSLSVSLPLSNNLTSDTTGGPLPPGEYSRRMVAITSSGEERDITFGGDFLNIVTIAGH